MFILYTKNNCIYCDKVKDAFLHLGVAYEERNIGNKVYLDEARAQGARTVPFLVDTTANVMMGESDDIIAYAQEGSF
jgi:glutaredoxin